MYRTHILSNGAIRGRHERLDRYLASARVEYFSHDVAGDEAAKALWKRKDPTNELPCVLVDGDRVGVSALGPSLSAELISSCRVSRI